MKNDYWGVDARLSRIMNSKQTLIPKEVLIKDLYANFNFIKVGSESNQTKIDNKIRKNLKSKKKSINK